MTADGTPRFLKDPFSGISHGIGLVFALVGSGWLLGHARDGVSLATLGIYTACLVVLYTASTIYHLMLAGERLTRALRLFDHVAIFLFVAGTSTPVLVRGLSGDTRVAMLSVMWGVAFVGILAKLLWKTAPRALYTLMYVGMGWSVVGTGRALMNGLSAASFALVVAGGVVYTLGAVVYALKWPNPRPERFGFHEIWHLFVLGGSALHFAAIALLACGG